MLRLKMGRGSTVCRERCLQNVEQFQNKVNKMFIIKCEDWIPPNLQSTTSSKDSHNLETSQRTRLKISNAYFNKTIYIYIYLHFTQRHNCCAASCATQTCHGVACHILSYTLSFWIIFSLNANQGILMPHPPPIVCPWPFIKTWWFNLMFLLLTF